MQNTNCWSDWMSDYSVWICCQWRRWLYREWIRDKTWCSSGDHTYWLYRWQWQFIEIRTNARTSWNDSCRLYLWRIPYSLEVWLTVYVWCIGNVFYIFVLQTEFGWVSGILQWWLRCRYLHCFVWSIPNPLPWLAMFSCISVALRYDHSLRTSWFTKECSKCFTNI